MELDEFHVLVWEAGLCGHGIAVAAQFKTSARV
jgi:hypothetical protein